MLILNDGFLKVFQNIGKFEGKGSFEGWIRRICFRCLSDHFRKEKSYVQFLMFEDFDKSEYTNALNEIYYEELIQLVDKLPSTTAKVFRLYAIDGFKHREIAELLQISVGTSKWHLSEARNKMKNLIDKYQGASIKKLNYGE
jgi:RNA polymerase sigma-70 factor (ECF subfamily)